METAWMLVVLALYGAGMYMWGYRKALGKAMGDMQEMKSNLTEGRNERI